MKHFFWSEISIEFISSSLFLHLASFNLFIFVDIYSNLTSKQFIEYVNKEQPDTQFDLTKRCRPSSEEPKNNVVVEFDCSQLTPQNFQILVNLSDILKESGEVGEMELEIFKFNIKSLDSYERELINVV